MYKIAIVDDDIDIPVSLGNYFPWKEQGFDVVAKLFNGSEALAYLEKNEVDVLICDISMPGINGIDIIRELHNRQKDIKIIILSAYTDFQYAKAAMFYGVRHYIVKPATYSELSEVLKLIQQELDQKQALEDSEPIPESPQATTFHSKIISEIITYINEHIDTVTLVSLADVANMNASYLSRFFKEQTGENLSSFINKNRMEKALKMLKDERIKNIYEIGIRLGYGNAKSFTKAFKKYYGMTPQEYRNNFFDIK